MFSGEHSHWFWWGYVCLENLVEETIGNILKKISNHQREWRKKRKNLPVGPRSKTILFNFQQGILQVTWRPNQPLPKIINALANSQISTNWKSSTTKKTVALPNLTPFIYPCLRALTHSCAAAILISFSLNLFWRFLLRGWWMLIQFLVWKINCCPGLLAKTCNWQLMSHRTFSIKASLVSPYFVAYSPSGTRKKPVAITLQGLENIFNLHRDEVAKVTSKIIQQRFFGMFRIHSKIWLPLNMTS